MGSVVYCYERTPEPGQLQEVAPGVHWIRMPLPFRLNHINLWLLEDGEGWTIVDTGVADAETKALWRQIFTTGLRGGPVRRLIVTHHHVDHIGLAGWLVDRWGVDLWTSRAEWLYARMLHLETSEAWLDNRSAFFLRSGMPPETVVRLRQAGNGYSKRVNPPPQSFLALEDGATFRIGANEWRIIIGTGHAPAQVCLYCRDLDLLIAGDQILPRISPNISVWPTEPDADPLADYLASLKKFRTLPHNTTILPSHDRPFKGLHVRIDELVRHHRDRLDRVLDACARPASAREVQQRLFPRALDDHQMQFAIGEGLAHIHYLINRGDLSVTEAADGSRRYSRATIR